jgi:hypothetical protein
MSKFTMQTEPRFGEQIGGLSTVSGRTRKELDNYLKVYIF